MNANVNAVSVVGHLRDLSENPENRSTLLKDQASIRGLILFLTYHDTRVVMEALTTFKNITESRESRVILRQELGLLKSLRHIIESALTDPDVKSLANEIYSRLDYSNSQQLTRAGVMTRSSKHGSSTEQAFQFLSPANKKAHTLVFYLEDLSDKSATHAVERELLRVKGVISFTFTLSKQRCHIRVKRDLPINEVIQAFFSAGIVNPQQVIKNEFGKEELLTFTASRSTSPLPTPDYLPDEESVDNPNSAIRPTSDGDASRSVSWMDATVNFLARSVYW